jgi:beta-glucosidase
VLKFICVFIALTLLQAQTPELPAYKNSRLPIDQRIADLLSRMTLEEKVDLVGGAGFKTKKNVRLCIPELLMTDGPLGPNVKGRATNYSAAINMAATFDTALIHRVAENIGEETRILGRNMLLAPMINIVRTPFGGRTFEFFGEDPWLVSRMTVAYVRGVQSRKVATCTKVIAVNNQEWNRFDVDVIVSERALREIYLPAIKAAVQEADTWTIMAAYNQVNGDYACENKHLLNDILKEEWGFKGAVVSDWGGARSTVKMAESGLDLEMPTGSWYGEKLLAAIRNGQVAVSILDDKVKRILWVMFRAGLFDESIDKYGGHSDTPERRALALKVAQESIVLLKNEHRFLPLDRKKIRSIAVIGPNGDVARMKGAGSGALNGNYSISPLQGIREAAGSQVSIDFKRGFPAEKTMLPIVPPRFFTLEDGSPGIYAEYYNNRDLQGKPVLTRVEKDINFDWGYGGERDPQNPGSPQPGVVNLDQWSARWKGKLKSPGDGWYEIGLQSDNGVRLYLDGKKILDYWIDSKPGDFKMVRYKFTADKSYDLEVEFYENIGSCVCKLGLDKYETGDMLQEAVDLAKASDVVILCAGLSELYEGEAIDRDQLALPEDQLKLIERVIEVNKNTLIVLNNATPVLMDPWIKTAPAIIEAFYPGQEGGHALADIIFGDVNPSGKLPITFPARVEDSAVYGTYPGQKNRAEYKEGIFVGYRYFDKKQIEPLFPFGYGLSYTTFTYSDLHFSSEEISPADTLTIKMTVKNTGSRTGEEIIQLYVRDLAATVEREVKSLKGFVRISLKPGESKTAVFKIDKHHLAFYDENQRQWIAEPGEFEILVGNSSRDIRLTGKFRLNGPEEDR